MLLKQVSEMHKKFGITPDKVTFYQAEKEFRIMCLREEIQEYEDANNPADELDALVDLMVFALGTVDRQGFAHVFEEAFRRVMEANCKKEVGPNKKRLGFQIDLVKPEGWTAPDLSDLVEGMV